MAFPQSAVAVEGRRPPRRRRTGGDQGLRRAIRSRAADGQDRRQPRQTGRREPDADDLHQRPQDPLLPAAQLLRRLHRHRTEEGQVETQNSELRIFH